MIVCFGNKLFQAQDHLLFQQQNVDMLSYEIREKLFQYFEDISHLQRTLKYIL